MLDATFRQMFDASRDQKKGLIVFFHGQSVPGIVESYSDDAVVLYSQQYDRIVVRIDRIDGLALP